MPLAEKWGLGKVTLEAELWLTFLVNGSSRAGTREFVLCRQKLKQTRQYRKASEKQNAALLQWTVPVPGGRADE